METAGGPSVGVVGCFDRDMAGIRGFSVLGAATADGREGFRELSLLRSQLEASARSSEASLARHLSPLASGRVRVQVVRA